MKQSNTYRTVRSETLAIKAVNVSYGSKLEVNVT